MTSTTLTQRLQSCANYERLKLHIKDLQRAQGYLEIAREAARRHINHLKAVEDYDRASARYEPWTFILTKEQAIKRALDTQAAYHRLMRAYKDILKKLHQIK